MIFRGFDRKKSVEPSLYFCAVGIYFFMRRLRYSKDFGSSLAERTVFYMKQKFAIKGMSCSACAASVERAVKKLPGIKKAEVNLLSNSMLCEYNGNKVTPEQIAEAINKIGFSASFEAEKPAASGGKPSAEQKSEQYQSVKTRLIVSIIFLVLLMYVSMGHMIGLPLPAFLSGVNNASSFAFTQFLLTLPVLYVNRKFFTVGFRALARGASNMDTLVAVGSTASVLYGIASIYMINYGIGSGLPSLASHYMHNLYFESASMILTLVTVGKFLEQRSRDKSGRAVKKLIELSPQTAVVERDGEQKQIAVTELAVGDVVIIKSGDKIPIDGIIIEGSASIDQSALTGESIPVEKSIGDRVMSASISKTGFLKIRAEKVGSDTTLAKIIELVENAGASKAPIARLADKISGIFVPTVMSLSALTLILWLIFSRDLGFALTAAVSVLVISCPCALGLATPVAITVAVGRGAENGILIKSAQTIEQMHSIGAVMLDKTGTLTCGTPSVTDVFAADGINSAELLSIAASLEKKSEHPLAEAIVKHAESSELKEVSDYTAVPGMGISGTVGGRSCAGGNAAYMQSLGIDIDNASAQASSLAAQGKTVMYFCADGKLSGIIAVADTLRPTSREAVQELRQMNIDVIMLTGDNGAAARAIAQSAGIEHVISDVLPADKEKQVADLRRRGVKTAMVGDGINDSPALASADIGIAIGGGSDIALDCADVVLMKSDLRDVAAAIKLSRMSMRIIKQNLFWAFFYNVLGIPIAAGLLYPSLHIMLSPMIAAAAMSLSSLFVVTNALRIFGKKLN